MDIIQIPTTQTPGAGLGDVVGPASSTDNAIVRYDTTTGRLLQNSTVTIADSTGAIAGATSLTSPASTNLTLGTGSFGTALTVASATGAATFAGAVTVATGNLVIGTAGNGIDFSADPSAAGMTSELLDDYEEGTFTPIVSDAASAGNLATVSDAEGVYTKIGNMVYWRFNVVLTSKASASAGNTVFIQGLPFQSATIPNGWYNPCATIIRNITFAGYVQFHVSGANSYGFFRENVSNAAGDDIIFSDLTNSAAMQVSGFYKVA